MVNSRHLGGTTQRWGSPARPEDSYREARAERIAAPVTIRAGLSHAVRCRKVLRPSRWRYAHRTSGRTCKLAGDRAGLPRSQSWLLMAGKDLNRHRWSLAEKTRNAACRFDIETSSGHDHSMAKTINVVVTDDIDGSPAAGTVSFTFNGQEYEIDLSQKNRDRLEKSLQPFIDAGRRAVVQRKTTRAARPAGRGSTGQRYVRGLPGRASRCPSAAASAPR